MSNKTYFTKQDLKDYFGNSRDASRFLTKINNHYGDLHNEFETVVANNQTYHLRKFSFEVLYKAIDKKITTYKTDYHYKPEYAEKYINNLNKLIKQLKRVEVFVNEHR